MNRSTSHEEIKRVYDSIKYLENSRENSPVTSSESSLEYSPSTDYIIPIQPYSPIQQMHLNSLLTIDNTDDLYIAKRNCLHILMQFIEQNGNMQPSELEQLKTQVFHSPQDKIQFYKTQMENQKYTDLQKSVIKLIKDIQNSATFEEIDEFILKFEKSHPCEPFSPTDILTKLMTYF